ncbi:hypothetical protein LOB18_09900 [Lactobacillus delbrueckii subsp. lactis]|nr:hypothetical protein [Lactobacillus delbrueckii subsp. lactis]
MTAFTGVDSQNLPDVMVSVQFILAIGDFKKEAVIISIGSIFMTKVFGYVWLCHSYTIDHS